jgi:hypothetical protein
MSLETELISLTQTYLESKISLGDLYMWVQERQEALGEIPSEANVNQLAGAIMLAEVEQLDNGADEEEVRGWLAEDLAEIVGSRALP